MPEEKKTTKKSTATKKPSSSTVKKTNTNTKKQPSTQTSRKLANSSKVETALQSDPPKKPTVSTRKSTNNTSKSIKNDKRTPDIDSRKDKVVKKSSSTKKTKTDNRRVKRQDELTTLEVLEQKVEGKEIKEKKPLGKTFYLLFSIVFFTIAFFYVNNVIFDNADLLQSAIFAFAALFIVFVLMLFNIHMVVINFFILPFRRLFKQARREVHHEIIFSVGKNKVQTTLNKYQSIFTLILYTLIFGLLLFASIRGSLDQGDKILKLITDALITEILFLVIVCSWQYLFNIIPSILDKSIDAKNGYILTLSAAVMVIYITFLIFDITYLDEIMIFVLIIGFIALLGVNMNMIVGEINIFSNLRNRKSKAVTRVVFSIFFGFHIYVILYASVVAYSIYNWEPNSFVFSSHDYQNEIITELYDFQGNLIEPIVYWDHDNDFNTATVPLTDVYDSNGNVLTEFVDEDLVPVSVVYDSNGNSISLRNQSGNIQDMAYITPDGATTNAQMLSTFYNDGEFATIASVQQPHGYGDFLYWTVVSVSTIGYGDVHPSTEYNIAMGWGAFLGIYGLTFFALSISYVSNIAMEGINSIREENRRDD